MRGAAIATVLASLAIAATPAIADGTTDHPRRYYVGSFDGVSQSHIAIARDGLSSIRHIDYKVRMVCKGSNTRLVSGFTGIEGNPFEEKDGFGSFRGVERIEGSVGPAGGIGTLRAHFRGSKHFIRRCDTGRLDWNAERVTYREYRLVLRDGLGIRR